jgi:putative transposase
MPTKWRLYYHIVWATKERLPLILPEMELFTFEQLKTKSDKLGGYAYAINGMPDHVHVVASVPPNISIAKYVGEMKGSSSRLISLEFNTSFEWQHGYGVFSVSKNNLDKAVEYVTTQKEHHRSGTTIWSLERVSDEDEGPDSAHPN